VCIVQSSARYNTGYIFYRSKNLEQSLKYDITIIYNDMFLNPLEVGGRCVFSRVLQLDFIRTRVLILIIITKLYYYYYREL